MEQEKLTNQKETITFLCNKYPKCFFADGSVKPLKIGIFQDLASELEGLEVVSKRLLRVSLRHYTSSWRYLLAVKAGVARISLTGEDGEAVEEQHAQHAAEQLKESKEKAAKYRENNPKAPKNPAKHKGYVKSKGIDPSDISTPQTKTATGKTKSGSTKHSSKTSKPAATSVLADKPQVSLAITELHIGNQALVKLGKDPMPVTITDIAKDGISVQLKSGMTVKVQQAQLFSSQKAANN
ncbi:ProP effector [Glaciecola punicea ACAM 611]|uniref:RNA chaperone ProQ n=1 Tax=Glaciecola punicea ACAM 611 TaxID=1121923 RepID=H5T9F4_9ALTE|nr:RNA chaperone ProQ [Glaciecola punicea]GAB54931.1 ProP effector [Glaciecola punicea ACAM 611]